MDGEDIMLSGDSIMTGRNDGKFCAACGNFVPSYKTECDVCHGTEFVDTFDEYKQRKEAEIARLTQMRQDVDVAKRSLQSEEQAARQKAEADALEKLRLENEMQKRKAEREERREKNKREKGSLPYRFFRTIGRGINKFIDWLEKDDNKGIRIIKVIGIAVIAVAATIIVVELIVALAK